MWFWTVQIRENMKKWCRRVSNGRPKIHQKSLKINSGPNDHQNCEKLVSQDPECLKNCVPRPRKINKSVKQNEWNLLEKNYANPTNLSNPSSLQINSQLVARGAGGRGGAFRYPPRWCKAPATRAVQPEPCTHSCTILYILCVKTQELTLVSSF